MVRDEEKEQMVKDVMNENVIIRKSQCYFLQTSKNVEQFALNELDSMMMRIGSLILLGLPYSVYCGALIDVG